MKESDVHAGRAKVLIWVYDTTTTQAGLREGYEGISTSLVEQGHEEEEEATGIGEKKEEKVTILVPSYLTTYKEP